MDFDVLGLSYCEAKDTYTVQIVETKRGITFDVSVAWEITPNEQFGSMPHEICCAKLKIDPNDLNKLPVVNSFDLLGRVSELVVNTIAQDAPNY